jgi:signal transduction histidine kinase
MTLRSRIALALLVIAVVLVAPAVYSLSRLSQLQGLATQLRERDAAGALALVRLRGAFQDVSRRHATYLPFIVTNLTVTGLELTADEYANLQRELQTGEARVSAQLDSIAVAGYEAEAEAAREHWDHFRTVAAEERRQVDAAAALPSVRMRELSLRQAEAFRDTVVVPAMEGVDAILEQLGGTIDTAGADRALQAQRIADEAVTGTLLALAIALSLAMVVATLLTRSLTRPISELRRGMSEVASGSFDPTVDVPVQRRDEIGDLARSFHWMTSELAEYDRLRSEFVSIASHELKTPLSVIKGYVTLLHDGIYGEVPQEQRKVLRSVSDQSDRLGRLIQQLLDISRFEAGGGRLELRPIESRAFLAELATSFEALAIQNSIDFDLQVDPSLPESVVGDPDRLNEVVGNLLSNAFKFTPREGRIRLHARGVDGGVEIEVEDSGVGIPAAQLPRIFEKFFQVDNPAQPRSIGSGLGLAIAKEIVEAHGGTITAESEEGHGTTFAVVLPLEPRSTDRASTALAP